MRKFLKNNILEIFKTIHEAHGSIKQLIEKKDFENVQTLLADCRNTAVQIGTIIESTEGQGFVTVGFLEEYCEALYKISMGISDATNSRKAKKILDKKLYIAEESVRNEIKVKLEVVFLPYKASMWDSLESIWKAADADPDCNAYVIPIPYYDRNPDGSFGEMHYEGAEFPEYVPIIHYDSYNLEMLKPDVIYYHNPYDQANFVTSVDPRFYSSELKKYSERLVYIPYFVVSNNLPEHFATAPGCVNADIVAVQSKEVRDTYISAYKEAFGDKFGDPESKFIALGSPKFDCVLNNQYDKNNLPVGWREKTEGKRVILYNTSLGAILNGDVQYLEKLYSVLKFFKEHNNDAVLWWRPHPLSASAYDSMRHELLGKYKKITEWYKKSDIGIYDDTADVHRAIALSDAYYGDRSSLVAMYQLTGKPVMIQNIDVTEQIGESKRLMLENLYDDGEYLWFSSYYFNGLFRFKKSNMQTEFVGLFPDEHVGMPRLYINISEHNGKLFFSPLTASQIAVYDLKTGEFEKIDYKNGTEFLINGVAYAGSVEYKDDIIFFPYGACEILRLNTVSGEIVRIGGWADKFGGDKTLGFFSNGTIVDNKLYLPSFRTNRMLILNLDTNEYSVITIGNDDSKFADICRIDNSLVLCPSEGNAWVYDMSDGKQRSCEIPRNCLSNSTIEFVGICPFNNKAVFLPYNAAAPVQIDVTPSSVSVSETDEFAEICAENSRFSFFKKAGNQVYTFDMSNMKLWVYDCVTKKFTGAALSLSPTDEGTLSWSRISSLFADISDSDTADNNNLAEIPDLLNISDMVNFLSHSDEINEELSKAKEIRADIRRKTISNPDGTAGKHIHETIKSGVI